MTINQACGFWGTLVFGVHIPVKTKENCRFARKKSLVENRLKVRNVRLCSYVHVCVSVLSL